MSRQGRPPADPPGSQADCLGLSPCSQDATAPLRMNGRASVVRDRANHSYERWKFCTCMRPPSRWDPFSIIGRVCRGGAVWHGSPYHCDNNKLGVVYRSVFDPKCVRASFIRRMTLPTAPPAICRERQGPSTYVDWWSDRDVV